MQSPKIGWNIQWKSLQNSWK